MGDLARQSTSALEQCVADEVGGPSYIPTPLDESSNHVPLREDRRHGAWKFIFSVRLTIPA